MDKINVYSTSKSQKSPIFDSKKNLKSCELFNFKQNINKLDLSPDFNLKGIISFLNSKYKAMEDLDLNDEIIDDEYEISKKDFYKLKEKRLKSEKKKKNKKKRTNFSPQHIRKNNKSVKLIEFPYPKEKKIQKIKRTHISKELKERTFFSDKNVLFAILDELNKNQNK